MNWIDFAILGIILLSTLVSLIRGFVKEAISLSVWIAAFFIAKHFYPYLAVYLTNFQDEIAVSYTHLTLPTTWGV